MTSHQNRIPGDRNRRVIKNLMDLNSAKPTVDHQSFIKFYLKHGYFTPKQVHFLVTLFHEAGIEFSPADLKISLRQKQYKDQLRELTFTRVLEIWKCMSVEQRKYYNEEIAKYPVNLK